MPSSRKKKSGNKKGLNKILLVTAILNLVNALLTLVDKMTG